MSWNYRVIRTKRERDYDDGGYYTEKYEIHEVYYSVDDNGKLIPTLWSTNPMSPYGTDLEELKSDLELMGRAFILPVLEIKRVNGKEVLAEVIE